MSNNNILENDTPAACGKLGNPPLSYSLLGRGLDRTDQVPGLCQRINIVGRHLPRF